MAKKFKKGLSLLLAMIMCISTFSFVATAQTTLENGNIWHGDEVKLPVTASDDAYNYMIAQPAGLNYYETSHHTLKIKNAGAVHIFPIIDTNRDIDENGFWTPKGIYQSGVSNYDVVYCCDAITGTREDEEDITNTYYKRLNLEDSEYFSVEQAERLRAILSVSYPALSVEDAKVALKAAGFEQADMLDRSELIAATQGAIWRLVNADSIIDGVTDYRYRTTVSTSRKAGWGGYLHDYSGEQKNFTDGLKDTAIDAIGARINALQDFFVNTITPVKAEDGQVVITKLDIVSSKIFDAKDKYDVTLNVELNHGADADDEIYITAYVNDKSVKTEKVEGNTHSLKIEAAANDDIKVVVSGTQNLERGVYFYAPKPQDIDDDDIATSREVSQNLIGVAAGETSVYAEAEATIRGGNIIEKESTPLNNENFTDVTLSVNGDVEYKTDGAVDIVIALGAGIAKPANTVESIHTLVKPLIDKGINVKLGLVAVEHYDDVAMELTELTKDNYETIIAEGLAKIIAMPAGPTNLHGNIVAAKAMLDADKAVPAANKFFYVIGTGRTYNFDNENGVPTTIINKLAHNGHSYYYWGHYLWQSQRGQHTSCYRVPVSYNNDFDAFWADVEKWVEADGDKYAYSFPNYDTTNAEWFNEYMDVNGKKLNDKSNNVASSPFGWLIIDLTDSGVAAIGSGANPQNALNYERAQYEAYYAYKAMVDAGYTCQTLCSESVSYQNYSPYMTYLGVTPSIQLGHSFMDHMAKLSGQEASTVLFNLIDDNGNYEMATNFFAPIDTDKLVDAGEATIPFVEDYIGCGDDYNFDFTGEKVVLTLNGVDYTTNKLEVAENGADATYTFTDANGKVGFKMDYFRGNGTTEERFVWYFLESLEDGEVTLSYQLELVKKSDEEGTHIAQTNQSATLYPTGDRNYGQLFPVPEVTYTNIVTGTVTLNKVDENGNLISDAVFELYKIENGTESLVGSYELDTGKVAIDDLAVGSYKLVEVQAPEGYIGIDKPMYFEIVKTSKGKLEVKNAYELEFPATAYEISNHITSVAIPQTFVLLNAENANDWAYTKEFVFGESDYDVVYCADSETGVVDGTKYYRVDLEDVFGAEKAAKLSAIVANSYPYVSVEDMIAAAVAANVADAENLTRGDIIAAVQLAIWHNTNDIENYTYKATYSVEAYPHWGKVFNDYSEELGDTLPNDGNTTKIQDDASDARIRALYNYLLGLDTAEGDTDVFVYVPKDGKDASQMLIGGAQTNFYTNGMEISVVNVAEPVEEEPEDPSVVPGKPEVPEEPEVPEMTVSFNSGDASNISFMLIDPVTGEVEFLEKIDIGSETSFEIPAEEGKISAVFVKQSTSGMFWTSEKVDDVTAQAVIDCLEANNPSYKGYNAFAYGDGEHELEFKKNKFVTYTFAGATAVLDGDVVDEPVVDEPVVEEPVVEEPVVEEPVVEEPVVEEDNTSNKNNGNNKNKDKNNGNNKNKNKNK